MLGLVQDPGCRTPASWGSQRGSVLLPTPRYLQEPLQSCCHSEHAHSRFECQGNPQPYSPGSQNPSPVCSADERFDATFHTNVLVNSSGHCQYLPPGKTGSLCLLPVRNFREDEKESLRVGCAVLCTPQGALLGAFLCVLVCHGVVTQTVFVNAFLCCLSCKVNLQLKRVSHG